MSKKKFFNLKNVVISVILFATMLFVGTFAVFNNNKKEQQPAMAVEWVDKLMNTSIGQGITKSVPAFTFANGVISLSGSIYKGITAAINAKDGNGVGAFFKALIGGENAMQQQILDSLNAISGKIDVIDAKVNEMKTQLDGISSQLTTMLNVINQSVEDIKVSLYTSELEMKEWTTIYNQINYFYNKYADVKTTLITHIDTINARSSDFENFLQNAYNLNNGEQIKSVVNKITLNYQKSYNALTQAEKNLLDTEIELNSNTYKVGEYIKDYNEFVYTYLKGAYDSFASGYSSNMYMTFLNMSDYILGNKTELNNAGIGEVYYKLSIMGYSTSTEVHSAYKKFVANVLTDFMLTGYVCDMSLQMQATYLQSNNGNTSDIQTYKDYIANIKKVIQKCIAYLDYEYQKCIYKYDVDGFTPANGYTIDDYVVLYGNTVNKLNIGNLATRYILKKDYNENEVLINNQYVYLASGESSQIKIYYINQEIQNEFQFESSNESVAIVSATGNITGLMPGDCIISIKKGDTSYPIVSVSVSTAYVVHNGTSTNKFEYDVDNLENCFSIQGTGLTYKYNSNIVSTKNIFDTDTNKLGSIYSILDVDKSFLKDYTFFSNNSNIVIDGDKIKTHISTSGTITAVNTKENIIIQIPVNGATEKIDINNNLTTNSTTDQNTIYIYTKEQLKQWHDDTQNKVENVINKNVKLMSDIDFEWDEWTMIYYGHQLNTSGPWFASDDYFPDFLSMKNLTFDGNGHEIRNITLCSVRFDSSMKNAVAMFYAFAGTLKNLTINNVLYKNTPNWEIKFGVFTCLLIGSYGSANAYQGDIINCVVTGNALIEVEHVTNYSNYRSYIFCPFAVEIWLEYDSKCPNIKNCINNMNVIIDADGEQSDVNIHVFGIYFSVRLGSDSRFNYTQFDAVASFYSGLQSKKCYNIYAGNVFVINAKDNSKVNIDMFTDYSGDLLSSIKPTLLYYGNSVCSSTDCEGNVKYFSSEAKGTKITYAQSQDSTFWSDRGFSAYNLSNLIVPYNIPSLAKNYFNADFGSFNATYLVGTNPDTQKIKFYDKNGNDVTKNVKFSDIDINTVGEKTIDATYGSETISFKVNYVDYESGLKIEYRENEENTENIVVENNIAPNSFVYLENAMFTKENCIQVGWSKTYGGEIEYSINQKIKITEDLILYPVFEQIESDDQAKTITITRTKEQFENGTDLTSVISQLNDSENSLIVHSDNYVDIEFGNSAIKQLATQNDVLLKVTKGNNADYENCIDSFIITLNGKQFNSGEVKVSFEVENANKGKLKVYYINENNERVDMNAVYSGNTVSFNTNHFSTYIVVLDNSISLAKLITLIVEIVILVGLIILLVIRLKRYKKV